MARNSDKKTTIILLIVLAISVIGGGIWTYNSLRPLDDGSSTETSPSDNLIGVSLNKVYQIKTETIANIEDFMPGATDGGTIWENFYTDKQFNRLNDIDLEIDIENYLNNPIPFIIPSSTEEEI